MATFANEYKDSKSEIAKSPKLTKHQIPDIVIPIKSIHQFYTYHKQIGNGASGWVFLAESRQTHRQYALKQMLRSDKQNRSSFIHEINTLKQLHHPNIILFHDAYISDKSFCITTQYCSGGTLFQHLHTMKRFSERDCAHLIKNILSAVDYIHSKDIVHRDLKLVNIVFDNVDIQHSQLKLIDFGQSELITDPDAIDLNIVGSIYFMPPEAKRPRRKRWLFAGDLWSIGVIAYALVEGVFPFYAKNFKSMMRCISKSQLKWLSNVPISNTCKMFIQSLLNKNLGKRLTAKQALEHSWIVAHTNQDVSVNFKQKIVIDAAIDRTDKTASILSRDPRQSLLGVSDQYLKELTEDIDSMLNEIDAETAQSTKTSNVHRKRTSFNHANELSDEVLDDMDIGSMLCEIDADIMPYNATDYERVAPVTPDLNDPLNVQRLVLELLGSLPNL